MGQAAKRPARMRMVACPECGGAAGFIEVLTNCTVVRRVDAELDHVDTVDWEPTPETRSTWKCVRCGAKFSAGEVWVAAR